MKGFLSMGTLLFITLLIASAALVIGINVSGRLNVVDIQPFPTVMPVIATPTAQVSASPSAAVSPVKAIASPSAKVLPVKK